MTSAIAAKPRPAFRLNQKAELVPSEQFARWHEIASATSGLSRLELALLSGLREHHRRLCVKGFAGRISIERMALDLDAVLRDVRAAVRHLIKLCLVAVRPGAGKRASEYLLALPKHLAASLAPAVAEDLPPL